MSDHIHRNNWDHIIDECFDIDTHEEELEDLQRDFNSATDEKDDLNDKINTAFHALDDLEIIDDDLQKEVDKIKDMLS